MHQPDRPPIRDVQGNYLRQLIASKADGGKLLLGLMHQGQPVLIVESLAHNRLQLLECGSRSTISAVLR